MCRMFIFSHLYHCNHWKNLRCTMEPVVLMLIPRTIQFYRSIHKQSKSPEKYGMKSLILSQTSTVVSLLLRMGESFHPTLHYVCEFTYQCWGTNVAVLEYLTWQPWCHMCHLGTVNKHTYWRVKGSQHAFLDYCSVLTNFANVSE